MSIAVSAVIVPSNRLRWLLALACVALCASALAMLFPLPQRFAWRGAAALAPLCAGLALGWSCLVYPAAATARRIDISGVGQIRLTVQQGMESFAMTMTLLPGATAWAACLLLRLRSEHGAVRTLLVLPDSVTPGAYRALSVAVRALAGDSAMQSAPGAQGAAGPGGLPTQIF